MVVGYLKVDDGHFEEVVFDGVSTGCCSWDSFYWIRCTKFTILLAMLLIEVVTEFGESGRFE